MPVQYAKRIIPIALLISIPVSIIAICWTIVFPILGVPLILVSLYCLAIPYWVWRAARRSAYVITDRRAIILDAVGWRSTKIRSFGPDQLKNFTRREKSDGSGDVVFVLSGGGHDKYVGFLSVSNAKEVEGRLRALVSK
jgi:hypothetical protein